MKSLNGCLAPSLKVRDWHSIEASASETMKLQMTKNSFWVVIPKTKVKKKGWKKGTHLDWLEYPNGDLVLQEVAFDGK